MIREGERSMRIEFIFFMQLMIGALMLIFLRKQMEMKKQMDEIIKEVTNYISYITEETEEELEIENQIIKRSHEKEKEEAQSRLIQAVLGEYFP